MSREILFRAKCIDNGEWVYGVPIKKALVGSHDGYYPKIIPECDGRHQTVCSTAIKEETIGQYTGLTDKNGSKIFEGDVVKGASEYFCNSSLNQKAVVLYDRGQFVFAFGETLTDCKQLEDFEVVAGWNGDVEVIGNIYDNRELLRGGKQ